MAVIHLQEECSRDGPSKYTGEYVAVILLQEECSRDGLSMGICTALLLRKGQSVNKLMQWVYALLLY